MIEEYLEIFGAIFFLMVAFCGCIYPFLIEKDTFNDGEFDDNPK